MLNPSYLTPRRDVLAAVADLHPTRVLDVGCAAGAVGAALTERTGARVTGIELDPQLAELATERLCEVLVQDASSALRLLLERGEQFDLVLCADVLEHLQDPWTALRDVAALSRGHVVVSLPNIGHISTISNLLFRRYWPYKDRGIHDRTHLRFFGEKNLPEFFAGAGLRELRRHTTHRVFDEPRVINHAASVLRYVPVLRGLTTYQFISVLVPDPHAVA